MARKKHVTCDCLENVASRAKTNVIATVQFTDDDVSFYDGPGMLIRKTAKPCMNSTWIALLINGFVLVKTWLLIARDTAFNVITRVSGQLQTRLEQWNRSPSPATSEQLLHMQFVLFAVYQNVKTSVWKTNMPVYAWKIFLENAIEMVSIIPSNRASEAQTSRTHHHLASSHRTQRKHLVFISEKVTCIHVWQTPFSVVGFIGLYTTKLKAEETAFLCPERYTRVSDNFSLMLCILFLVNSKKY